MTETHRPRNQGGNDASADATTGGGASTDRGGRDAGMPGPAPGSGPARDNQPGATGNTTPPAGSPIDDATSTVTNTGPSA